MVADWFDRPRPPSMRAYGLAGYETLHERDGLKYEIVDTGGMRSPAMSREGWQWWGETFGWELVRMNGDSAEFCVPNDKLEQGCEFISISERVSDDISRALDIASEAALGAYR
jgi:hypothetical protein